MSTQIDSIRNAVGDTLFYYAVSPLVKIVVLLFLIILPLIAYLTLAERRVLAFMQARLGPNRVGPWGLLQPIADVAKLLVKGDSIPLRAVKWAFVLAPCLVVGPAIIIFSVIFYNNFYKRTISELISKNEFVLALEEANIRNNMELMERTAQLTISSKELVDYLYSSREPEAEQLIAPLSSFSLSRTGFSTLSVA